MGAGTREIEKGGPCRMLKLRQIGTYGIHFRGFLPWLVLSAGKREYFPALAGLVDWLKRIFSCLGRSSGSVQEKFSSLSWSRGSVQEKFSSLSWSSGSVQEKFSSLSWSSRPVKENIFLP